MHLLPARIPELICRSAFSFQEGTSTPAELVSRAVQLGLPAIGITDRDGVYALPRAHRAVLHQRAAGHDIRLIHGALITIASHPGLALLAHNKAGWSNLCRLLTQSRCAGPLQTKPPQHRSAVVKGRGRVSIHTVLEHAHGLEAILLGAWTSTQVDRVREAFDDRCSLALTRRLDGRDGQRWQERHALSQACRVPLLATHDVCMHAPSHKPLLDVLTCLRRHCTLQTAGRALEHNATRHLRSTRATQALFAEAPKALWRTVEVADRCTFQLTDLAYQYPHEVVPSGQSPMAWLQHLTEQGLQQRYPTGVPPQVSDMAQHELSLIEKLNYPAYFLTVYDCVRFARQRGILCQGRGSAANSVVCFALGITAVDPTSTQLLFERFLSEERGEPPDIDVDFEHERREEVLQYVYEKYGRERAAMICNVITYRRRSALRDAGKVLGLSEDQISRLCQSTHGLALEDIDARHLREAGLDPTVRGVQLTLKRAAELRGLPRHLGLHSGGFTISDQPLTELVPIEPASMDGRTVIQWDKDDIDIVGFVKVDLLSLGMLTAIRKCLQMVSGWRSAPLTLACIPAEDEATYDMLCRADSVGVFQVESRAQMSMLPRLKPRTWYDLVVQVSIVRPGPIQGGMVHPYLAARADPSLVHYAHPSLKPILSRTAGVPIFQEQVMAMAVAVGGFTPGQADQLRRAMGAWRKHGGLEPLTQQLMDGMTSRGIPTEYAQRITQQIQGFGEYGFPESHAASFAHLVYVSSWLKCHWPAAFTCALLNSQPMGFYSPRSLISDARRHHVQVRPICIQRSDWDCTLEPTGQTRHAEGRTVSDRAVRLGFRMIKGLREADARHILEARMDGPFRDIADLARRTQTPQDALTRLAHADALHAISVDRRTALWAIKGIYDLPLFRGVLRREPRPNLRAPSPTDELINDFDATGFSLNWDPVGMVRSQLTQRGVLSATAARQCAAGQYIRVVGLISHRQRPGTASGMLFMTMEDETGMLNLVVRPDLFERKRSVILGNNMLQIGGTVQRDGDSLSILCRNISVPNETPSLSTESRDFR